MPDWLMRCSISPCQRRDRGRRVGRGLDRRHFDNPTDACPLGRLDRAQLEFDHRFGEGAEQRESVDPLERGVEAPGLSEVALDIVEVLAELSPPPAPRRGS